MFCRQRYFSPLYCAINFPRQIGQHLVQYCMFGSIHVSYAFYFLLIEFVTKWHDTENYHKILLSCCYFSKRMLAYV